MIPENKGKDREINKVEHSSAIALQSFESALSNLQCVMVARRTLLNPEGVTWPQYDILDLLRQFQPMTPSVIGEKLGFTRTKISKTLRTLKDADLVEQESSENDKREMLTRLSEKGSVFLKKAESSQHKMADLVASCMSPGEIAIFTELCSKAAKILYDNIPSQSEEV